jgi:hypothetical protein
MTEFINDFYLEKIAQAEIKDVVHNDELVIDALLYDWQMWHYNYQITILPWKSIKIINYGFGLELDDNLDQLLNARIQKNIIQKLEPALLGTISKHKNA